MIRIVNLVWRVIPDYDFICQECYRKGANSFDFNSNVVHMRVNRECETCAGKGIYPIPALEVGLNGN